MTAFRPKAKPFALLCFITSLAACNAGGFSASKDTPFAPGVDYAGASESGLLVGHRLVDAGEYELAIKAYSRAAIGTGLTADIYAGIGSANLGLGRLGQAEENLRDALETDDTQPETWNNLGVVLMEQGETAEAAQIFRRAYALDDGESDAIRDNLRLALAKLENSAYNADQREEEFKLVRRGSNDYLLRKTP